MRTHVGFDSYYNCQVRRGMCVEYFLSISGVNQNLVQSKFNQHVHLIKLTISKKKNNNNNNNNKNFIKTNSCKNGESKKKKDVLTGSKKNTQHFQILALPGTQHSWLITCQCPALP